MTAGRSHALLVEADLVAVPSGDLYDDLSYDLTWHLRVGAGREAEGPAGAAALRPSGSALVAWFDYAQPEQLLAISVPFGKGEMREDAADEFELVHRGRFSPLDGAVLDLLVGGECRSQIENAPSEQVSCFIESQSSWSALGRLALMDTYLDRTDGRPVDGLWALEQAGHLRTLAPSGPIREWAIALVERSRPVLHVIDTSWANLDRNDGPRLELEHWLAAAHDVAGDDLGALAAELRAQRSVETLDYLERVVDEQPEVHEVMAWRSHSAQLTARGRGGSTLPEPEAKVDFSAEDLVLGISVHLDGARLHVEVNPAGAAQAVDGRLEIRVSTRLGRLLAGAVSMSYDDARGTLRSELTLPPGIDERDIVVVVGRHLPLDRLGVNGFIVRQAIEQSARALDGARRIAAGETDRRRVNADRSLPIGLWRNAGDDVRADQLATLPIPRPFLAERLRQHREQLRPAPSEGTEPELAAYRSLAWSMGDDAEAARIEARRLRLHGHANQLSDRALEELAIVARRHGDVESARTLEEAVVEVLYS